MQCTLDNGPVHVHERVQAHMFREIVMEIYVKYVPLLLFCWEGLQVGKGCREEVVYFQVKSSLSFSFEWPIIWQYIVIRLLASRSTIWLG